MYAINNFTVFRNKVEPFPIVYLIFGLRSWSLTKGNYLTTLHWTAKVYTIVACSIFVCGSFVYIPPMFIRTHSLVYSLATVVLLTVGTLNLTTIWLANVNSKTVIKIFKNFDNLERVVPRFNGFIHQKSNFFIIIHFLPSAYVLYNTYLMFQDSNFSVFGTFQKLWKYFYIFTADFSIYHFCNFVNMSSSYCNIIKISLCKIFKKSEYYYKPNDPFMYFAKSKVIQCASLDPTEEPVFSDLEVENLITMYDKLMDTVEHTNCNFNMMVRFCWLHLFFIESVPDVSGAQIIS